MKRFKPGVGFSDFLVLDSARGRRPNRQTATDRVSGQGGWRMGGLIVVVLGILMVRAATLQVVYGGKYRILSDENRIQQIKLPAGRGVIYDRNGMELARNRPVKKSVGGAKIEVESWEREYPLGEAAAVVLGYLGEIGEEEIGLLRPGGEKLSVGDRVGRSGMEYKHDEELRGKDGGLLVEVENDGKVVRNLGVKKAVEGGRLELTLDGELQREANLAMAGKRGAVVASNPKTGEVLVLVSSPGFDPNKINAQYAMLNAQKDLPFLNRAIGAIYPPGSVFKMVTAVAAMMEKKASYNFTFEDTGVINVGKFSYTNWYFTQHGGREGIVGWVKAIARSTDTFFYKVGEMTGIEPLAKWANLFGLGTKTQIDLPGEVAGLIPTPEWKERAKGERWFLGNTYHVAIGQGDVLVTPMQVNLMTNILANGGNKCQPYLDKKFSLQCSTLNIDEEILDIVKEGMVGACESGGTAFPFFDFEPQVACKTGTAEYMRMDGKMGTHAWFTAFAPVADPTISVTVLIEEGGEGSRVAAPIARKVLAKYFGIEDRFNYSVVEGVGE